MKRIFTALVAAVILLQYRVAFSGPKDEKVALLPSNLPMSVPNFNHVSTEEVDGLYHLAPQTQPLTPSTSIDKPIIGGNLDHLKVILNSNIAPAHAPDYYFIPTVPMQSTNNVQFLSFSQLTNICFNKYFVDVYVMPQVMTMVPQSIKNMMPGNTINF